MRRNIAIVITAVLLVFGISNAGRAQPGSTVVHHGMFGPRVLGSSLQPKRSLYFNNFQYGPSGTFEGLRSNWTLPAIPTDVIAPGTGNLPDIYQALLAQPPIPVTVVQPQPAAAASSQVTTPQAQIPSALQPAVGTSVPAAQPTVPTGQPAAPAPELPLRRAPGATMVPTGGAQVASTPAAAATTPQVAGPQVLSPLQTPGGTYTTFRPDFSYAKPTAERTQAQLTLQLNQTPQLQVVSPIQVNVKGQTATLRGTVATSYDRAVAEQLVRMEAGIWHVDNQLKVGGKATTAPASR